MSSSLNPFRSPDHAVTSVPQKPRTLNPVKVAVWLIAILVLLLFFLLPATRTARPAAYRVQCSNNLKQIALALQNYQYVYGTLPPAYITDEDGTPMHSWRVLILPYLEQRILYEQYRFDEPWNGPNNRRLAELIPAVYRCPSFSPKKGRDGADATGTEMLTQYVVICDEKTFLPGSHALKMNEINEGKDNTLLIVELDAECVPWMAPRDIDLSGFARVLKDQSNSRLQHTGGLHVARVDGSVQFISDKIDRDILYRLFTSNVGE